MKIIGVAILLLVAAVSAGCGSRGFASGTVSQQVRTGFAPVNGLRVYFEIHGLANPAQPPLVLLHGGSCGFLESLPSDTGQLHGLWYRP